jgi:hypothetical protein
MEFTVQAEPLENDRYTSKLAVGSNLYNVEIKFLGSEDITHTRTVKADTKDAAIRKAQRQFSEAGFDLDNWTYRAYGTPIIT